MRNRLSLFGLAAASLCFTLGAAAQQSAPATAPPSVTVTGQKNPSNWFRAESQHFIVYSDTTNDDVFQLLNQLEKLDYTLRLYTKSYFVGPASAKRITLYYHDAIGGFNASVSGGPDQAVGLYSSCGCGVQGFGVHLERIANPSNDQLAKGPLNNSLAYLFEAYTRHFLYRYTDIRIPTSFIDGFAQYFSSAQFSDKQMAVGRVPASIGRYLHFIDDGHRYSLDYKDIFEPDETSDHGYAQKANSHLEFLAKSWLLTHFMLSSPANMARLDRYLELTHRDVPASQAFSEAFGIKEGDISNAMWRYRLKGVQVVQVDFPSLPRARISYTTLPEAATEFILADATLKSCPDRKTGESLLRTLSQHAGGVPNNDMIRLTLSRAQIDWGNPQDALPYLTAALGKDAANGDALYLLGLANLRLSQQGKGTADEAYRQAAISYLARARSADPASAQAAFAFYQAEMGGGDRPQQAALESAISAWKNAHEVNSFTKNAALAFAYLGRGAEADDALTILAHNARDAVSAEWAKTWQSRLGKGVSRADLVAEMRRTAVLDSPFKEWTVSTEDLMATVEYNAGVEEAGKYLDSIQMADPMSASKAGNSPVNAPQKY